MKRQCRGAFGALPSGNGNNRNSAPACIVIEDRGGAGLGRQAVLGSDIEAEGLGVLDGAVACNVDSHECALLAGGKGNRSAPCRIVGPGRRRAVCRGKVEDHGRGGRPGELDLEQRLLRAAVAFDHGHAGDGEGEVRSAPVVVEDRARGAQGRHSAGEHRTATGIVEFQDHRLVGLVHRVEVDTDVDRLRGLPAGEAHEVSALS